MSFRSRIPYVCLVLILSAWPTLTPLWSQGGQTPPGTAAYDFLDQVVGPRVDLLMAPIRPLAISADGTQIYAVNSHDSTVVHYDDTWTLQNRFRVPHGPVSLALLEHGGASDELLVVTKGTHALTRLTVDSGDISAVLLLPRSPGSQLINAEPADILVNTAQTHAYVSCQGTDQVVEIDLATNTVSNHYDIPSKHPTFLSWDGARVLVAPMFSGNNSTVNPDTLFDSDPGDPTILDLTTASIDGLPDEDLFRIDPALPANDPLAVEAVAKGMGTVLFAHGINPMTGRLWQLNTEALNKGPFGEPSLRGAFSDNRLSIVDLPAPGGPIATAPDIESLDDVLLPDGGGPPVEGNPIGQPYALTFAANGFAAVAGLLTDDVTIVDPQGSPILQWQITGTIPRAVAFMPSDTSLPFTLVYCWGSNVIEVYRHLNASSPPTLEATLDLGHDPTPPLERLGRELFYDGHNSLDENLSCATCHVEGQTDFLAWHLADEIEDNKGPLTTQTLRGIEPLAPFHWRGERRTLADFNGAFDELLGGEELDAADFAAFEAFVFSLANPANPNQDRRRLLNDSIVDFQHPLVTGHEPSAIQGQVEFQEVTNAGCTGCHFLPTGTRHDITMDRPGLEGVILPRRANFKPAPFTTGAWRKEPSSVIDVDLVGGGDPLQVATVGFAFGASGNKHNLFDFVDFFQGRTEEERLDITAFLFQFDQGLAPIAHRAVLLNATSPASVATELTNYYQPQTIARNCDLAVFGTSLINDVPVVLRWFWDRYAGEYRSEDRDLPGRSLTDFLANAADENNVFVALPVGMAERFAVDYDEDDIYNADNAAPLVPDPPGPDTTGPVVRRVELLWNTTTMGKFIIETDEYTTYSVTYTPTVTVGPNDPPTLTTSTGRFAKTHSVLLKDMVGGFQYVVDVTVTDRATPANSTTLTGVLDVDNKQFFQGGPPNQAAVVTELNVENFLGQLRPTNPITGGVRFDLVATIETKRGRYIDFYEGIAGFRLRVRVFAGDETTPRIERVGTVSTVVPGELSVSRINNIRINNLTAGDVVRVVVESLEFEAAPNVFINSRFSFPDCPPEGRLLKFPFPSLP